MAATSVNRGVESLPLKDRVAIVTGSSRGIGIAIDLSQLGANLSSTTPSTRLKPIS
ncbi:hypothetical protein Ddye_025970 [Dipteronia dyeriana]|uniref:Uncharacterized protein n=1 Tax=Dipteronia dyeriana TaxID=168575 RepID=A0AAD9WQ31_9ROSI|nr:hypothetical protein Ddye_025970 [Dipteronia dyeriana]